MIFYFSGTGNSHYVAKKIALENDTLPISINEKIKLGCEKSVDCDEKAVFVTPTYAWRIPIAVEDWIRKTDFHGAKKAWFVMTCGGEIGDAEKFNKALCEEKGLSYMGTCQIVMPENYIAMFGVPSEEESAKIIANAEGEIEKVTTLIATDALFPKPRSNIYDKGMSAVVNPIFYKFFVTDKKFYATDKCVSCGKCIELCPMENVQLVEGKPKWLGNCTHCMACISYCPTQAIEYGKKSQGKRRYRCEM